MAALAGYRREPSRTIGVVPKGANHIFWQTVRAGAIKAARENNYEVKWKAPALEMVSSRQIEIGERMAARRVGELLGGKGKVALIGFMAGRAGTMERESGFQDELKQKFPQIPMVGRYFSMADRAKALAATESVLAAHPALAGLFANNESSSTGAVQA